MSKENDNKKTQRATVKEVDGELIIDDPVALAVIRTLGKFDCKKTYDAQLERILHFRKRVTELEKTSEEVVIVVINVDDPYGGPFAEVLMPNTNWQEFRDKNEIPYARGIVFREPVQEYLETFDDEAAKELSESKKLAVVIIDHGVAAIF